MSFYRRPTVCKALCFAHIGAAVDYSEDSCFTIGFTACVEFHEKNQGQKEDAGTPCALGD